MGTRPRVVVIGAGMGINSVPTVFTMRRVFDELFALAGGSVHPAPGVAMAALSGRLAAASVRADLGLRSA